MLSDKQLQLRKTGIGASEAISVLGLDQYKSPLDIYYEKTSDEIKENDPHERVIWGQLFEDVIAKQASKIYEIDIINPGKTYRHKKYPFILATPDRLIKGSNEGIEIKNRSSWMAQKYGDEMTDEVLTSDIIQCQQNMLVTDRNVWHLLVLFGGNTLKRFRIDRNDKLIKKIIDRECQFWNDHVMKKIPPDPINAKDLDSITSEVIKDQCVICSDSIIQKIYELKDKKKQCKDIEKEIEYLEFQLKSIMVTSEYLVDNSGNKLISWKNVTSQRVDQKRLKEETPEIYEKYLNSIISRTFRILSI